MEVQEKPCTSFDLEGGIMTLPFLARILECIEKNGEVTVVNGHPLTKEQGSTLALEFGAWLASRARWGDT